MMKTFTKILMVACVVTMAHFSASAQHRRLISYDSLVESGSGNFYGQGYAFRTPVGTENVGHIRALQPAADIFGPIENLKYGYYFMGKLEEIPAYIVSLVSDTIITAESSASYYDTAVFTRTATDITANSFSNLGGTHSRKIVLNSSNKMQYLIKDGDTILKCRYNSNGLLDTMIFPNKTYSLTYNTNNKVVKIVSGSQTIDYTYDSQNRVLTTTQNGTVVESMAYGTNTISNFNQITYLNTLGKPEFMLEGTDTIGKFYYSSGYLDSIIYKFNNRGGYLDKIILKYDTLGTSNLKRLNSSNKAVVLVFPNPCMANLHFVMDEGTSYSVLNLEGKTLLSGQSKVGENSLDISSLANGLYILQTPFTKTKFLKVE